MLLRMSRTSEETYAKAITTSECVHGRHAVCWNRLCACASEYLSKETKNISKYAREEEEEEELDSLMKKNNRNEVPRRLFRICRIRVCRAPMIGTPEEDTMTSLLWHRLDRTTCWLSQCCFSGSRRDKRSSLIGSMYGSSPTSMRAYGLWR